MNDYKELIERLREYAEWARANEWEVPLCMGDSLGAAADAIENQQTHIAALMHQLDMARAERDAVTKRMIELEQELGRVKEDT